MLNERGLQFGAGCEGAPINRAMNRLTRHHTEYGQSGRRVQMKTLPAGGRVPPRPATCARVFGLFSHSRFTRFTPYPQTDSIGASRGA